MQASWPHNCGDQVSNYDRTTQFRTWDLNMATTKTMYNIAFSDSIFYSFKKDRQRFYFLSVIIGSTYKYSNNCFSTDIFRNEQSTHLRLHYALQLLSINLPVVG